MTFYPFCSEFLLSQGILEMCFCLHINMSPKINDDNLSPGQFSSHANNLNPEETQLQEGSGSRHKETIGARCYHALARVRSINLLPRRIQTVNQVSNIVPEAASRIGNHRATAARSTSGASIMNNHASTYVEEGEGKISARDLLQRYSANSNRRSSISNDSSGSTDVYRADICLVYPSMAQNLPGTTAISAIYDTGSARSMISQDTLNAMQIPPSSSLIQPTSDVFEDAGGERHKAIGTMNLKWYDQSNPLTIYVTTFYISGAANARYGVLIGNDFWSPNGGPSRVFFCLPNYIKKSRKYKHPSKSAQPIEDPYKKIDEENDAKKREFVAEQKAKRAAKEAAAQRAAQRSSRHSV